MREDGHDGELCRYCTLINAAVSVLSNRNLGDEEHKAAKSLLIAEFDRLREDDPVETEEEDETQDEGEDDSELGESSHFNGQRAVPTEYR